MTLVGVLAWAQWVYRIAGEIMLLSVALICSDWAASQSGLLASEDERARILTRRMITSIIIHFEGHRVRRLPFEIHSVSVL